MAIKERDLLRNWNTQRSQVISSQLAPTILLAVILILTTTGKLNYNTPLDIKALAMGLVVAGGVFSMSGILGSFRDSRALTRAIHEVDEVSQLGLSVARSSSNLAFSRFLFVALSLFNLTVLSLFLFKKP